MAIERSARVNELVKRILSTLIQRKYACTKVGWITISRVVVSKDLQHARVFFTVLGSEEDEKSTHARLVKDKSHLRLLLGRNIRLRYIPALIFEVDEDLKKAMHVDKLIDEARNTDSPDSQDAEYE
jgi:ribosome-binding factor A